MKATPEQITAFRKELKALVLKYRPEVCTRLGYYDEVECVNFCFGDKVAVSTDWPLWDFDDTGLQSLEQIALGEKP